MFVTFWNVIDVSPSELPENLVVAKWSTTSSIEADVNKSTIEPVKFGL